ncbi:HNH endonuclease [Microcoleus sp. LEGE 07076]|uniref:HNH endonuclease n=1 Tax=Microcoleus sp. LEGE 07076 TaxID=915322 RepID=UPI001882BC41|nr:HNH endonuclease [Microcoleus sp. LEGE 07076]
MSAKVSCPVLRGGERGDPRTSPDKLKGKPQQYQVIDEMIRTAQFVRNKALKYWLDNQGVKLVALYKQCAIMAKEFEWAGKLNSKDDVENLQLLCRDCHVQTPSYGRST